MPRPRSDSRVRWRRGEGRSWPCEYEADDPLHVWHRDVLASEADHRPSGQRCFEIFFDVGDEACGAVVAAVDENAALDLNERAAGEMGEVGAPPAVRVKAELAFEGRTTGGLPVEGELGFEAGAG